MSAASVVNGFFYKRYQNLFMFAGSPLLPLLDHSYMNYCGNMPAYILRVALTPILAPIAFVGTVAIAMALAMVTACAHALSLVVASLVDFGSDSGLSPVC